MAVPRNGDWLLPHGPASRDGAANDVDGGVNDLFAALGVETDSPFSGPGHRSGRLGEGWCGGKVCRCIFCLSAGHVLCRLGVQFQIDRLAARRLLRPVG